MEVMLEILAMAEVKHEADKVVSIYILLHEKWCVWNRGVAWIFEVVRRILIVCDLTITGRRPVRDTAGVARGGLEGGGGVPPEDFFFKLDL